jgi:hypothetical protein
MTALQSGTISLTTSEPDGIYAITISFTTPEVRNHGLVELRAIIENPAMPADEWLNEHRHLVGKLADVAEAQSLSRIKLYESVEALDLHARRRIEGE